MKLLGKTAIVTGAGRGIGKAIALRLAQDGASVVIADIANQDAAAAEVGTEGRHAVGLRVDVTSEADVERMALETARHFGGIDILVNNAARFADLEPGAFEEITAAQWREVMEVNVLGVFLCCRACVPHMRRAGGGRIINIASATVMKGTPHLLHYVSSKGAVVAMTRSLARELGAHRITVNAIAPGFTLSEEILKRPGHLAHGGPSLATRALKREERPSDLVGAASFLASEDAAFVTGQTLVVDGGSAMN